MPNCDFYATHEDHERLLHWLFAENTCRIFELSSDFEQTLKEFHSARDVLSQFDRTYNTGEKWYTIYLQLYVLGACPAFVPRRVLLDPDSCDGATFRYMADGWGLIQLYLATARVDGLDKSQTNHNSYKRAKAYSSVIPRMQEVDLWDFKKINTFSSHLNRQIKKLSVAKIGNRPVLPGAWKLWQDGKSLLP